MIPHLRIISQQKISKRIGNLNNFPVFEKYPRLAEGLKNFANISIYRVLQKICNERSSPSVTSNMT